jgi:replicative DNA helicase
MQIETFEAKREKRVLTAMVMEPYVLSKVSVKWEPQGLFRSRWANVIGSWAVDWHRKYQTAPKSNIETVFQDWAEKNKDETTITLVDNFLADLSDEYENEAEEVSPYYLVEMAGKLFNEIVLERIADEIKSNAQRGAVDRGFELISKLAKIELGVGAGIEPFKDMDAVRRSFQASAEPLIRFDGDLAGFMNNQFGRDCFVSLIGKTGVGKTWWLMELALRAVKQRRRVAFFEVGDMSEAQIMKRLMVRITGVPLYPQQVNVPVGIRKEENTAYPTFEKRSFDMGLDEATAIKACEQFTRRHKKTLLKLSVHPNRSINVAGISDVLDTWERDDWVPDVVVIDYADILAEPAGHKEREAINETWMQLRGLSQKLHCLVLTATQGDAGSYTAETIRRSNFNNDRRVNDHVTGMLGLNVTDPEKKLGITRLNWTKCREAPFNESQCCYVAGCLEIGRPCICSVL